MTQDELQAIREKLDNSGFDLWDNDWKALLLDLINQHVKEVIGEEKVPLNIPWYTDTDFAYKAGYNQRTAEQRKRAGL